MIWAVLDTNTLVSGLARGGVPGQVIDFIVTGDARLLDLGACDGIQIVRARRLLAAIGAEPPE